MPIATAKDGCPINYEVEGPANAPVLMLCNSLGTNLHMWDDQARRLVEAVPAGALRPPRSRQVRRAERPLHDGHAGPRRAGGRRRRRREEVQLVRPVDGRHGRTMDGRQCARPRREARPLQHALLLRRQAALARPHQVRPGQRPGQALRPADGALVHQGLPRQQRRRPSTRWSRCSPQHQARRLRRLLRGGARHGLPRLDADHHRADHGDRRHARTRRRCRSTATRSAR